AAVVAASAADEAGSGGGANEPWRFLGDDLDLLRAFAELLNETIPEAAQALVNGDDGALAEATGGIVFACNRLGFERLRAAAEGVATQAGAERVRAFAELMRKVARYAALVSTNCGVTEAVVLVHDLLRTTLATS